MDIKNLILLLLAILLATWMASCGSSPKATGTTSETSQTAITVAYKIGDTGPAGGIIFYDKGNNRGGWQYLEVAPAETEQNVIWKSEGNMPDDIYFGLKTEVGSGKTNTENLMSYFSTIAESYGWATQVCDELEVNGFDDWYLPSIDELNYMFSNLHRKGLGGFKDDIYWSSSEGGREHPWVLNLSKPDIENVHWNTRHLVRAVRQF